MNTSFTPGPWVMTEEGEDDLVVCSERGDFICAPSGATFGEVIDNARLIAASPLLLQELIKGRALAYRESMTRASGELGEPYLKQLVASMDAAINLATGQEP